MSTALSPVLPDAGAHAQISSANLATVVALAGPKDSKGGQKASMCWLTARTNGAYVTFDGSVPTAANGIDIPVGVVVGPLPMPRQSNDIQVASQNAAGASVVNGLFAA